jgi:hypothetical protein
MSHCNTHERLHFTYIKYTYFISPKFESFVSLNIVFSPQMVNTFLVHTDFLESAKLLDRRRLPNQRREAYQILCNIQRLKAIGQHTSNPLPNDPYLWYAWIRTVIKQYRQYSDQIGCNLVKLDQMDWQWIPKQQTFEIGKKDLTIKFGYIYHPAVLMWLGYEEALKEYLNAHIVQTIARGIKNTMDQYSIKNAPHPPWTYDPEFTARHRAMLLKKELDRNESPWYQLMNIFTEESVPCLYYWPFTPSIGSSAKIQGEADLSRKYACIKKIRITLKQRH